MKHQHLSPTKNDIAFSNRESTIASSQFQTNAIARSSTHPIAELQGAIGDRAVNQQLAYAEKLGSPKLLTREHAINHHQR
jgi:hypothetical protein